MTTPAVITPDSLPDLVQIRDLVATSEPEIITNTREDLLGIAEMMRSQRDTLMLLEALRAARIIEWHMAERWPANPPGAHRTDDRPTLASVGKVNVEAWQKVYAVGASDLAEILAATDVGDLVQRAFGNGSTNTAIGTDDYFTPAWLFDRLGITFDLDVCAPLEGPLHVPATRWFSEADDGLTQPWEGRVWMNPPYSKPAPWIQRFIDHGNGIAFVPFAKSSWFFDVWNSPDVLTITAPGIKASEFVGGPIFMPVMLVAVGPVENHDAIRRVGIVR